MSRPPVRSAAAILAIPLALALVTFAGLVAGLTGSGWRDVLCAAALVLPLLVFLFHLLRQGRTRRADIEKERP